MPVLIITVLLPVLSAAAVALILHPGRRMTVDVDPPANHIPKRALLPAVLFTSCTCVLVTGFRVLYPLSAECRYWQEEGWSGRWQECPGDERWKLLVPPVWLALLLFGGIIMPRLTVKRLSADGVFSSRRYLLTVVLAESALTIPLSLYTWFFFDNPFHWLSMMPSVEMWCAVRVLAAVVTAVTAEKAWRAAHPERKKLGRTFTLVLMLPAYTLLTAGGYNIIKSLMGEYHDCPCELEGLAGAGVAMIFFALVIAAAALVIPAFTGGVRIAYRLAREK